MNYWLMRDERKAVEENGLPVKVKAYPDWTFHVRQAGTWSKHFQRAIARLTLSNRKIREYLERAQKPDYVPTEADRLLDEQMQRDAFAEGCLVGWEGVTDRDGEPLKHNAKNARMLLEQFDDIFKALVVFAENPANFPETSTAYVAELAAGN